MRICSSNSLKISSSFSSRSMSQTIGFIGLGNMGGHMATNLLKAGHSLVAFDVQKASLEKIAGKGAQVASCPREVAEKTDIVITMLPSSPHVQSVYKGEDGILSGLRKGSLCIDSSTIDPIAARDVALAVSNAGGEMIDAPVSGGVGGAEAGTLTFMVGGEKALFEKGKPILQRMGKNIVHCGGTGNGQVAKICNNLILAISMAGVSEAMNLAEMLGMDPKVMAGIVNSSSGRCWSSDTYNPVPGVMENVPSSRGYTGGFAVDLMAKDVSLAMSAAQSVKTPLPLGGSVMQLYYLLSKHGYGQKDFSSVFEYLSKNNTKQ